MRLAARCGCTCTSVQQILVDWIPAGTCGHVNMRLAHGTGQRQSHLSHKPESCLPYAIAPHLLSKRNKIVCSPTIVKSPNTYAISMIWLKKFVKTSQNEAPTVGQYISLSKPFDGTAYPTEGTTAGTYFP